MLRRPAHLKTFDSIMVKSLFVDVEAKAWPLWNHAFSIGIFEGLLAVEKRKESLAIIVGEERRRQHGNFLIDRSHRRRYLDAPSPGQARGSVRRGFQPPTPLPTRPPCAQ